MGPAELGIECPAVDVRALDGLRARAAAGLSALASSARLRLLLDSPEGRDASDVVLANRDSVVRQIAEVGRSRELALHLWIPKGTARAVVTVAREVGQMLRDAGLMASVGGAPLADADAALADRLLAHIEAVVAAAEGSAGEIRMPPRPPADMLETVRFWKVMDARMREMRDTTALPRAAVTLPDEFDEIVAELWESIMTQAQCALDAGEEVVEVRFPRTEKLRALASWAAERMELLEGLVRAGMVQKEWERPLKIIVEMFQATLTQLAL